MQTRNFPIFLGIKFQVPAHFKIGYFHLWFWSKKQLSIGSPSPWQFLQIVLFTDPLNKMENLTSHNTVFFIVFFLEFINFEHSSKSKLNLWRNYSYIHKETFNIAIALSVERIQQGIFNSEWCWVFRKNKPNSLCLDVGEINEQQHYK